MKRLLAVPVFVSVLLVGCSSSTVAYNLEINDPNDARHQELVEASTRVIERRLASIGQDILDLNVDRQAGDTITISVADQEALDALTEQLTEPFVLKIMEEAPEGTEPDITVEGHGGFRETGIEGSHLEWLSASEEPGGKGRVTIVFTEDGRQRMAKVFLDNVGKNIGLFVKEHLVSKLHVETAELKDDIIITDIPSVQLARIFADDVNVGLHVTFSPVP